MKKLQLQKGFSLTEVLMAAGILAVGLMMIAGTFPVGIFLTAASVEQTIAPIVTDEAFAKIQLYDVNVASLTATTACADFNNVNNRAVAGNRIDPNEYQYPSINTLGDRVYHWSAICRRVDLNDRMVQVTVFVSRKTGSGLKYLDQAGNQVDWPTPRRITTSAGTGANQRRVTQNFITGGYTIVADMSGNIYRVLDHTNVGGSFEITLDKNWSDGGSDVWVVPAAVSGGRSPVIGVYQRIIKF
jgi:prepilin-type N-terminal cleavage/methylation domain-containing protein